MSAYAIAAIPTIYCGRQYRSRLEAKWAAFFDLLGWRHEYEPFDLGKWSPDFLVHGDGHRRLLVEVKPIDDFDEVVGDKIADALEARGMQWDTPTILVGVAPRRAIFGGIAKAASLGWLYDNRLGGPGGDWVDAFLGWSPVGDTPRLAADVFIERHRRWWSSFLQEAANYSGMPGPYIDYAMSLWAQATNAVQWQGKGRRQ